MRSAPTTLRGQVARTGRPRGLLVRRSVVWRGRLRDLLGCCKTAGRCSCRWWRGGNSTESTANACATFAGRVGGALCEWTCSVQKLVPSLCGRARACLTARGCASRRITRGWRRLRLLGARGCANHLAGGQRQEDRLLRSNAGSQQRRGTLQSSLSGWMAQRSWLQAPGDTFRQ